MLFPPHTVRNVIIFTVKEYIMSKALKVTSWLCLIMALIAAIFGLFALFNRPIFMGYALFSLISRGNVMGFIGNLFIMVFTVACYGLAGLNGIADRKKQALIWSALTALLAVVSLIVAFSKRYFTFGDIIVAAIPVAQLVLIIKSED